MTDVATARYALFLRQARRGAAGLAVVLCAALLALPSGAAAKTLRVGPGEALKLPSDAAAVVKDGDTVEIAPTKDGYFDCAVWGANHVTIEGKGDASKGEGVVLTDKTCQGKAIFVTIGEGITIRNLTFARARVPDKNGAGIRAEGKDLTIEHSRFINNENGILTTPSPESTIRISDSEFSRNGKCDPACAHGVYIGTIKLLRIERSTFRANKEGHHVKSRAMRSELIGNTIEDGPEGTSSYLVDISNGGALLMEENTLEKGPHASNRSAAVVIGGDGVTQKTPEIIVRKNRFANDMATGTLFVRNLTATEAVLEGNSFTGMVKPLEGDGAVR